MIGWLTAAGLFFLAFVAAMASQVVIEGKMRRRTNNDYAVVVVTGLWGFFRYRMEIPFASLQGIGLRMHTEKSGTPVKGKEEAESNENIDAASISRMIEQGRNLLRHTMNLTGVTKEALAKVRLTEWRWSTAIGTGDAVWTAMTTGAAWSVKTTAIGVISQLVRLQTSPQLEVMPLYNVVAFQTDFACTAKIRLISAVVAGIKIMNSARKVEGGLRTWLRMLRRKSAGASKA